MTKEQWTGMFARAAIRLALVSFVLGFLLFLAHGCRAQQWDSAKVAIVKKYERLYRLPHGIYRAFNQQENSGHVDSFASPRVEHGWYNVGERHYKDGVRLAHAFLARCPAVAMVVPFEIERLQEATSWGEVQLMGFNYRALGYSKPYFIDMTFEERVKYWALFFSGYLKRYKSLERAVKMYNGPAAHASYTMNVLRYQRQFAY